MKDEESASASAEDRMTDGERIELRQYEDSIQCGLKTFVEVGRALDAIRDKRLYRETHSTWATYLRERWSLNSKTANGILNAARLCDFLREALPGVQQPSQCASIELMKLAGDTDCLKEVWAEAVAESGEKRPTVAAVSALVDSRLGNPRKGRRDTMRREHWAEGDFGEKTPSVTITLTEEEGEQLARVAREMELGLPDAARKLVVKGLKFYAE